MSNEKNSAAAAKRVKFGTDGFRGVIAKEFTFEEVAIVAFAVADHIYSEKLEPLVYICYDRRFMSDIFARHSASVFAGLGISCEISKTPVPTPALSAWMRSGRASLGIMITASHNPYEYNGMKIKTRDGASAPSQIVEKVQERVDGYCEAGVSATDFNGKFGVTKPGSITDFDPIPGYLRNLRGSVDIAGISRLRSKLLINPMFGSQAGLFGRFAKENGLPLKFTEINSEHNPLFPGINPEPIMPNLGAMAASMASKKPADRFAAGFCYDGDGDRIAAMTSSGGFVSPQIVYSVLLYHLAKNRGAKGAIARTVSVTSLVSRIAAKFGLAIHETPIGFKYIADLMLDPAKNIAIGGEESGGIGISTYMPERDGLYLSLMLLEVMAFEGKDLDEIIADIYKEFGAVAYDRNDYRMSGEKFEKIRKAMNNRLPCVAGRKVVDYNGIDGHKYYLEDGSWILFRFSGTEPVLRIYAESADDAGVRSLLGFAASHLEL